MIRFNKSDYKFSKHSCNVLGLVSNNPKERPAKSPQATSQRSSQNNFQEAMRVPSLYLYSMSNTLLPLLETSDKKCYINPHHGALMF